MTAAPPGQELPPALRTAALWSAALLLIGAAVAGAVWLAVMLRFAVVPLIITLLGVALLNPLSVRLQRLGLHRTLAAAVTTVVLLLALAGGGFLFVKSLVDEAGDIASAVDEAGQELSGLLGNLPGDAAQQGTSGLRELTDQLTDSAAQGLMGGLSLAAQIVTGGILALVLTFFLLRDGHRFPRLLATLPAPHSDRLLAIVRTGYRAMAGYMRGTTLIALIDSFFILIGLLVLRVPGALGLSVLVFLGAYVPFVGAFLSGTLAVLVAFADRGPAIALWTLGVVVAVQQIEGQLLQPVIQSRTVSLHPAVVMLAIAGGAGVAGILGALLAVPFVAALFAIVSDAWHGRLTAGPAEGGEQDSHSGGNSGGNGGGAAGGG
ncbi:AI-2E family transporter [Streptomyces aidingensis]|uniref:Predicted PurR-regulated permease PerM n=1 Tax=Streptomyces aidingensis TaxID=910347 RepID=A0A1I1K3C5_9ACTN|nr:AI-2E family transporter [Streptomyces aidingensis]SFC55344.1 Predicted PurR-regulated permease PerM [Streptomyces aidingensis]